MDIVPVPAFADNYLWLVHDEASGETAVVDPGDAAPVLAEAGRRGWTMDQVWNTHWHPDHTGGNAALKAAGAKVIGPAAEAGKIPTLDIPLKEGDRAPDFTHQRDCDSVVRLADYKGRKLVVFFYPRADRTIIR